MLDILGIRVGKLSLELDEVDRALGDTLRGQLKLELIEPKRRAASAGKRPRARKPRPRKAQA